MPRARAGRSLADVGAPCFHAGARLVIGALARFALSPLADFEFGALLLFMLLEVLRKRLHVGQQARLDVFEFLVRRRRQHLARHAHFAAAGMGRIEFRPPVDDVGQVGGPALAGHGLVVAQVVGEFHGAAIAVFRLLRQGAREDALQGGRGFRGEIGQVGRGLVHDAMQKREDGGVAVALEGGPAGQHFEQHHAQGKNVGAAVERLSQHLLRRHVLGRAQHHAGLGHGRRCHVGDAEIGQLGHAHGGDHDVGRLNVPVHDAQALRVIEAVGNLRRDIAEGVERQSFGLVHPLAQRLALQILHGDIGDAIDLAHVVDGDDGRVVQPPGRLRFADEALLELGDFLGRQVGIQRLDCNRALDNGIEGLIDGPHGATAQFRHNLVAS